MGRAPGYPRCRKRLRQAHGTISATCSGLCPLFSTPPFKPYCSTTRATMSVHSVIAPIPGSVARHKEGISGDALPKEAYLTRLTDIAARQLLPDRPDDRVSYLSERVELRLREWVCPHKGVHGGEDVDSGPRWVDGAHEGRQEIVACAVG